MRRIAASNDNSRGASNSQYAVTQRSNVQELSEGGNLEGGNLATLEGGNLADEFSPLSIDDNRISSPGPQAVRQAETSSSREELVAENLVQSSSRVASGVESGSSGTELSADNLVGDEASEEGDNLVGSEEEEQEEVEADQSESRRVMREEEVTSEIIIII